MLGLPGEQEDDIAGIAELSDKIAREYYTLPKDQRNGKVNIVTSTSIFVQAFYTVPMGTDEYKGAGEGKAFLFVGQDQKSA